LAFLSFSIANIGFADQIAVMHESTDHSEIRIISSQKTDDYAVVTPFQWNIYPELSRDGRLLAFVGGPDQEHLAIQLKNLETGTIDQISETVGFVLHPAFSGDAQKLSYSEIGDNGKNHIVVFNRLTGLYDKIEDVDASLFFPQLNSDGSFIVYQKSLSKTERVLIEKYLGEDDEVELKLPSRNCMAPNISFDDRKIAFTCLVDGLWNVYMMDRASKTVEQITTSASRSFAPAFDRHGQIYYAEEVNGKFEIYVAKRVHEEWTSFPFWSLENSLYSPSLTGDTSYSQSDVSDVPSPARSSFGGLELNGKLYLIGGHQGHEHTYPPESFLDRV
ncbi:MAG: hypothetical protein KDD25_02390, partial [Bdellovibrionales bacterium]|nr:hypothetical protein [Bdellovibrionales bacterium]